MRDPSYTLDEMREQATKAVRYFERGLEGFDKTYLAVSSGEAVLVVARGASAEALSEMVESGDFGKVTAGVEDVNGTRQPAPAPPVEEVTLIPLYHEPKEEFARKGGHIHLHVLNDAKLGRRVRKSGECLCTKKHGSKERTPNEGETKMCAECVKVASENGLAWTL